MNLIYEPDPLDLGDWKGSWEKMKANFAKLMKLDWEARQSDSLVGRVISHPYADGRAWYQVIKVTKRTAIIRVCTGLGDDWVLPAWGEQTTLNRQKVQDWANREFIMAEAFGGHPANPNRKAKSL